MKHLLRFLIARAAYYIQEISYAPSDIRQWRISRKKDREFRKKYEAICKKAGIKP